MGNHLANPSFAVARWLGRMARYGVGVRDQKLRDFLLAQSPVWLTEQLLSVAAGDPVLLAGFQIAASGSDGAQVVRRELDPHHARILALAERAAKADGIDAVVDVLARDLRSAGHFQRICQELMAARRVDQALEWANEGLTELEGRIDHGLPDLR